MKSQNKLKPVLLKSPEPGRVYVVDIQMRGGQWNQQRFNDQDLARQEFDRIRGLGIHLGLWIEHIELKEELV